MSIIRSDLERELALVRASIAWRGGTDPFHVAADSLVYNFGITEIDGVKIELDPGSIYEVRGD